MMSHLKRVLVSDFDGTMTRFDFYKLAIEKLIPLDTPNYWDDYRTGRITHHEALRRYFAAIQGSEREVMAIVDGMELDPDLAESIAALRVTGWETIVASAGCAWYIQKHLNKADIHLEVHANPGRFEEGRGLLMDLPEDGPFQSANLGVDKTAIVRSLLDAGAQVAFAGDGFPDVDPARLVPDELRFARGDLADVLARENLPFRPYDSWSEIASIITRITV